MQLRIARSESPALIHERTATHRARMVFGAESVESTTPFLLMVEDWFSPPAGFPPHPHRGMETVTFVLDGELQHRDHTGAEGLLGPDSVAFMTAGRGVIHSEMPGQRGVHLLQLWLNLPRHLKRVPAQFQGRTLESTPLHQAVGAAVRVYAGRVGDAFMSHGSTWPLSLLDIRLDAGAEFLAPVSGAERAFLLVLEGTMSCGTTAEVARQATVCWIEPEGRVGDTNVLRLTANTTSRALLFASPPIDGPIVLGGPFVMNTEQEIREAFADLDAGRLTST